MDSAELLNIALDKYMKNLIRSSVELVGRSVQRDAWKGTPPFQFLFAYTQMLPSKDSVGVALPAATLLLLLFA
jgi:hypothetical protein